MFCRPAEKGDTLKNEMRKKTNKQSSSVIYTREVNVQPAFSPLALSAPGSRDDASKPNQTKPGFLKFHFLHFHPSSISHSFLVPIIITRTHHTHRIAITPMQLLQANKILLASCAVVIPGKRIP